MVFLMVFVGVKSPTDPDHHWSAQTPLIPGTHLGGDLVKLHILPRYLGWGR